MIISVYMRKSTILMNICNPKISGLGRRRSWDSGLAKTAGIPGLQSLSSLFPPPKSS